MKKNYFPTFSLILLLFMLFKNSHANAQGFRRVERVQQPTLDPNRFPPPTQQGTINEVELAKQKIELNKAQIDRFERSAVRATAAAEAAIATETAATEAAIATEMAAAEVAMATEATIFGRLAGAAARGAVQGDRAGGVVGPGAVIGTIAGAVIGVAAALAIANPANSQSGLSPQSQSMHTSNDSKSPLLDMRDVLNMNGIFGDAARLDAMQKYMAVYSDRDFQTGKRPIYFKNGEAFNDEINKAIGGLFKGIVNERNEAELDKNLVKNTLNDFEQKIYDLILKYGGDKSLADAAIKSLKADAATVGSNGDTTASKPATPIGTTANLGTANEKPSSAHNNAPNDNNAKKPVPNSHTPTWKDIVAAAARGAAEGSLLMAPVSLVFRPAMVAGAIGGALAGTVYTIQHGVQ